MKKIDYADFGMRVRKLRHKQGLTQEELAQQAGISASFLGHLERGTRIPSMETLCMLSNVLKTYPRYFLASGLEEGLTYNSIELMDEERRHRLIQFLRQADALLTDWEALNRKEDEDDDNDDNDDE